MSSQIESQSAMAASPRPTEILSGSDSQNSMFASPTSPCDSPRRGWTASVGGPTSSPREKQNVDLIKALASTLMTAAGAAISRCKAAGGTLLDLSLNGDGMHKADVAALDRNFDLVYAIADLTECIVPTARAIARAIEYLDETHMNFKLTPFKQFQGRRAWYMFEGEKIHELLARANRICSRRRGDLSGGSMAAKIAILKRLWREHKPWLAVEVPPLDASLLASARDDALPGDFTQGDVALAGQGALEADAEDVLEMLPDYPASEPEAGPGKIEQIDVASSDDEPAVKEVVQDDALEALRAPKDLQQFIATLPGQPPIDVSSQKKHRRVKEDNASKITTKTKTKESAKSASRVGKVPTAKCAAHVEGVKVAAKRAALKRASEVQPTGCPYDSSRIAFKQERGKSMYQLRAKGGQFGNVEKGLFLANSHMYGSDEKAQAACLLVKRLCDNGELDVSLLPSLKPQLMGSGQITHNGVVHKI